MNKSTPLINVNEHVNCWNYERENPEALIENSLLEKGEKREILTTFPEIVYIDKGEVYISCTHKPDTQVFERELILLPPGSRVSIEALADCSVIILRYKEEMTLCQTFKLADLSSFAIRISKDSSSLVANEAVVLMFEVLLLNMNNGIRCVNYLKSKQKELMLMLRAYYNKEDLCAFFLPLAGSDYEFINFVYTTIPEVRTIQELAVRSHMSYPGFKKKFKKVFGTTPNQFITDQKNRKILHEIGVGAKPIKIVCRECGFSSVPAFTVYCKKHFGKTPANIRNRK